MPDPIDPFWSPPAPKSRPPQQPQPPVRWQSHDGTYWITDGKVIHPLRTMPLNRAKRLLLSLNEQAEVDLLSAFRDLPLLTALRRHINRLEQP